MKNHIKKFWDNQGKEFEDSHWASWGDNYAIQLEINTIANYLEDNDYVLDVGCANGYSILKQLEKKPTLKLIGIDYSESMIDGAEKLLSKNNELRESVSFEVGNILEIDYDDNTFDKVYTTRVLINLPTWDDQMMGLDELISVTKSGGKIIISEGFYEPLVKLNSLRLISGLEPLVEHDFNRYLKKSKLEKYLKINKFVDSYENIQFSSVYYLGSRLLRELVLNIDDYIGYENPINEKFFELEKEFSGGDFGIQQLYVIDKK